MDAVKDLFPEPTHRDGEHVEMEDQMAELAQARFDLRKVAEKEWLILDHKYGANDPRRTVGCVYEVDPYEVEVMWMRALPVATRYMSPVEALDDVRRLHEQSRATRPISIPHHPPRLAS
ncbi:hypothetical protein ABS642_10330 [Microbacterium sp. A8/3-1]|uniref:Uncharacterized protein n=1 Tax=Microbacterium sp. A8/3-1 TaxID=3160749 RepID=A0AAU7W3Z9_9MICO